MGSAHAPTFITTMSNRCRGAHSDQGRWHTYKGTHMDQEQQPAYRTEAHRIIENFLHAFQMSPARAATVATELVDALQPVFDQAMREAATPLLNALLPYSLDEREHGEGARAGIKAYVAICPPPMLLSSDSIRQSIRDMVDQAGPQERDALFRLFERLRPRDDGPPEQHRS